MITGDDLLKIADALKHETMGEGGMQIEEWLASMGIDRAGFDEMMSVEIDALADGIIDNDRRHNPVGTRTAEEMVSDLWALALKGGMFHGFFIGFVAGRVPQ